MRTWCCIRSVPLLIPAKHRRKKNKAQILKLSIEALTPAKLGQLCQDLKNMSWGCTTMAASVWVSQRKVDYIKG